MLEERRTFGPYKNLEDFITRVSSKEGLNKRTIENLIKAGALDTLGGRPKTIHEYLYSDHGSCESGEKIFHVRSNEFV